jgi:hypothetical protein
MLKNYVATSVANSDVTVCSVASGKELSIMSVVINGGADGGDITLKYPGGFTAAFTIAAGDTIFLDTKVNLPSGASFAINATSDGIKVMASAAELDA